MGIFIQKYDPYAQAFEGSCTIKYASDRAFNIFRGKKASDTRKAVDNITKKSRELIDSKFYDGRVSVGVMKIYLNVQMKKLPQAILEPG